MGRIDRRVESAGNGQDETETDSSSKTFGLGKFAVLFTRWTIPRLNGRKRKNNNLVDRGKERFGAVCCSCPFSSSKGLCRIDAHLFPPFHISFVSLPFLDLDAHFQFHRFRCSLLVPGSLVDATRLVG